ncbi:unnamed protein product [Rotaria sp. Silwood1]|nr:unnamed protein product [Rotaria sp. Silwood1]CAF1419718.1 unnamed protein product [Rotaria sp. Silwood1]
MDGLCCLLSYPCRKVKLTATADQHGLLELDRSQLVRTELLNTGNFDDVFKGKYGQRDVLIKYVQLDNENCSFNVEKFLDEAKIMKDLVHKSIIRL